MYVIFGLGNPGFKYELTRHNAGFLLLDHLSNVFKIPFVDGKGDYYFAQVQIAEKEILLIKPTTYMNNSGLVLEQIENLFDIDFKNLLIAYDDSHLPLGTLRFRSKGSAAEIGRAHV